MTKNHSASKDSILISIVPVLLVVVAITQIYMVNTASLSRWKGGGFGMFSTIDSPSARFLRVYVETDDGEIPVLVPKTLRTLARKSMVMPTPKRLTELAEEIIDGTWVYLNMVSSMQYYQYLLSSIGNDELAAEIQLLIKNKNNHISFESLRLAKMVEEEKVSSFDKRIPIKYVRVEVWKYFFDKERMILKARKHNEIILEKPTDAS